MLLSLIFALSAIAVGLNTLAFDRTDPKEEEAIRGGRAVAFFFAAIAIAFAVAATINGHGTF